MKGMLLPECQASAPEGAGRVVVVGGDVLDRHSRRLERHNACRKIEGGGGVFTQRSQNIGPPISRESCFHFVLNTECKERNGLWQSKIDEKLIQLWCPGFD